MSDKLSKLINDVKGLIPRQNASELIILLEKLSLNKGLSSGANVLGEIQQLTSLLKGMTLVTGQSNLTEEDKKTFYLMAEIYNYFSPHCAEDESGYLRGPSRRLRRPENNFF